MINCSDYFFILGERIDKDILYTGIIQVLILIAAGLIKLTADRVRIRIGRKNSFDIVISQVKLLRRGIEEQIRLNDEQETAYSNNEVIRLKLSSRLNPDKVLGESISDTYHSFMVGYNCVLFIRLIYTPRKLLKPWMSFVASIQTLTLTQELTEYNLKNLKKRFESNDSRLNNARRSFDLLIEKLKSQFETQYGSPLQDFSILEEKDPLLYRLFFKYSDHIDYEKVGGKSEKVLSEFASDSMNLCGEYRKDSRIQEINAILIELKSAALNSVYIKNQIIHTLKSQSKTLNQQRRILNCIFKRHIH